METILLADDNLQLCRFVQRVLENVGYHVLIGSSGGLALKAAEYHSGRIDLVLADVLMEDMGGAEFSRLLKILRPNLKVLFMSGYPQTEARQWGIEPSDPYLQKPFSPLDLARTIREVLDDEAIASGNAERRHDGQSRC